MITNSVLNTIPLGAGDVSLLARNLNVTSDGGTTFPTLKYPCINSAKAVPSLVEAVKKAKVSWSSANNTAYRFSLRQETKECYGTPLFTVINITSDATATDAEINAAIVTSVNAHSEFALTAVSTGVAEVTITAKGGVNAPLFSIQAIENVTVANAMQLLNIVSSTFASPIVVTTPTHNLVTGNRVKIDNHAVNTNANGDWRITKLSATTFSLDDSVGTGVGGATGTCLTIPQMAAGQGSDLIALGVNGAISGNSYKQYELRFGEISNTIGDGESMHTHFVNEGAANFATFDTALLNILKATPVVSGDVAIMG